MGKYAMLGRCSLITQLGARPSRKGKHYAIQ